MGDTNTLLATGVVEALAINGEPVGHIAFDLAGPVGDIHYGFTRKLSGHDSAYIKTSGLKRGDTVFNWRSWTGLAAEEVETIEAATGCEVPIGTLLENLTFSGIPHFSQLAPSTRLVFQKAPDGNQAILTVWEENGPCGTVGQRLETLHQKPGLKNGFHTGGAGYARCDGVCFISWHSFRR